MARGRGNRAINHGSILSVVGKFLIGIEGKKKICILKYRCIERNWIIFFFPLLFSWKRRKVKWFSFFFFFSKLQTREIAKCATASLASR